MFCLFALDWQITYISITKKKKTIKQNWNIENLWLIFSVRSKISWFASTFNFYKIKNCALCVYVTDTVYVYMYVRQITKKNENVILILNFPIQKQNWLLLRHRTKEQKTNKTKLFVQTKNTKTFDRENFQLNFFFLPKIK